ncbi:11674_t:CDS:2 [Funneliformis geosporum]|uniref:10752_t:CDS:1 n=1 Tax=Funneliformis geosporum TaxID=1117311 RepID=A0A9W4SBV8_9GLOM|nr:11674_t:CDS:2 [Funneliformis geosporum]CAI2164114.1 10752_t:CDS:2 [Funneliformis geosporum]
MPKPETSKEDKENYDKKLELAKKETIKNIQNQLRENDLDITELDDQRTCYSEEKSFLKELEKTQDPSLSMEEKEKIQQEAFPLI